MTILSFWIEFSQKDISSRKQIFNILHIWISLGTKFQLKGIIWSFWTKFIQKGYFQSTAEQAVQGLQAFAFYIVIQLLYVNPTVLFKHFKDLKDRTILNI